LFSCVISLQQLYTLFTYTTLFRSQFYYHRSYIKSQETYRHIAYIYHVNMKKSPDTYRVRAYFKGFISFLLCSVLLNPNNYFCDKQQKHSAVIYGSLAAAKKQIAKAVSPREHFVAMPPHVSLSKWVSIILAIPITIKAAKALQ